MRINIYQIDAFTDELFGGNPAAVCPLNEWINKDKLQNIAAENNLAETAFFVKLKNGRYHLRWFTPEIEMDLCGHATLASAYVIFNELDNKNDEIEFETLSGILKVNKEDELLVLDFPSRPAEKISLPEEFIKGFNIQPLDVLKARDYLLIYKKEQDVVNLIPDVNILNELEYGPGGIIVTAKSEKFDVDFVSRFFSPQASIMEDPVTGSAHCTLVPYWAQKLDKNNLIAHQVSKRGGVLNCQLTGNRVKIAGKALKYMKGEIFV